MQQSKLADYLDLTNEELLDMGLDEDQIYPDTGSSGEMIYSYYFNVPEETPIEILKKKGWAVGDRIEIDLNFFDAPHEPEVW
ncbi:TPA: hypothetical protein MYN16_004842 [Klebsiella pneumoniae]|uniref:hypothetical protein n=1 Tax=Klebsiella/Raoultella group TaxID=2890311 RepID=UPI000E2D9672|nr:hypothetical protein [Klebsiella pneumoniae]MCB7563188.1 hypothetical protein [Klebsiella pneumoniae]MCQ0560914.1 hypothetical protein [Klebsiella pneumoniae]MDX7431109.1 hypothetical protein [Klebsiella pneumoniae]SWW69170.1 Uncharacterised protein [Klebsiella pneumoniae]SWX95629.1 Uncharacterised protein [Klebsiella pneumoniae]